ncbi:hypothetical protein ACFL5Z_19675 [Planctomycetota bacterium]
MRERLILLVSLFLVLELVGKIVGDTTMPGRFYSEGTGLNEISYPADPNEAQPSQYPTLRRKLFDIGAEVYNFKYEEPGLMEEEGVFYGIRFGFTDHTWVSDSLQSPPADGGLMFRADGRLAFGQVDYDGGIVDLNTSNVVPYSIDDIDDWVFEGRLVLGNDWLRRSALHTVYAGIGYRYLNDDTSFDPAGYERESNYLYVPIGYQFDGGHTTGWSVGFGAEFDVFIVGNQRSHLSDVSLAYPDVDNRQESGYGYRACVKLQHKSKKGIFVVEPFIRYWDIDDSGYSVETFGTVYEPANETTEYGLSILWMF